MSIADWITERRELEQAATEGPWEWDTDLVTLLAGFEGDRDVINPFIGDEEIVGDADAAFIADTRTSLPAALDALEAALALSVGEAAYASGTAQWVDGYMSAVQDIHSAITEALGVATATDLTAEHRAVVAEIAALTADTAPGPVVPPKRLRELLDREQELSDLLAEQRRARAEEARRDALDDAREIRHGMEAWLS